MSTEATFVLLLDQVTALLLAFDGRTAAINAALFPLSSVKLVLLNSTPVTGAVTVTLQVAVFCPSRDVAVIVVVPTPAAYTVPVLQTNATLGLPLDQETVLSYALPGSTLERV